MPNKLLAEKTTVFNSLVSFTDSSQMTSAGEGNKCPNTKIPTSNFMKEVAGDLAEDFSNEETSTFSEMSRLSSESWSSHESCGSARLKRASKAGVTKLKEQSSS